MAISPKSRSNGHSNGKEDEDLPEVKVEDKVEEEEEQDDPAEAEVHSTRMSKLNYLLQRSQIYSKIMSEKMQKEKEQRVQRERRQQAAASSSSTTKDDVKDEEEQESKAKRSTRSGGTESRSSKQKTQPKSPQKVKRKNEDQKYNISDYLDKEDIEKNGTDTKGASGQKADLVTTSFKQPKLITGATLRDYQLYGVEWLIGKETMGSVFGRLPASTLQNWMDEIARFAPEMKALMYYNSDKKERRNWINQYSRDPKNDKEKMEFPIFVTSYEIAINDARLLGGLRWKFIIVDEGHRLKNRNARLTKELKTYNSANRLILTGTPVHNNLAELWSLLNFVLPDIFDNLEEFEGWFDFSDLQSEGGSARLLSREQSQKIISTLRDILDPFILQREKKNVEKDLPPKKEYMLYAPLTQQQKELYEEVLNNSIRAKLTEMMTGMTWEQIKETGKLTAGEGWDEPLRHASESNKKQKTVSSGTSTPSKKNREKLSEEEMEKRPRKARQSRQNGTAYNEEDETEKQFMDRMERGDDETPTKSRSKRSSRGGTQTPQENSTGSFSIGDIERQSKEHLVKQAQKDISNMHLQNPIMQLRKVAAHPFLLYWPRDPTSGELIANEDLIYASGKMMMLNRLLDSLWSKGHKVLLFSQFTTMLDILEEWCVDYKGVTPFRIDGTVSVQERAKLMKEFNTNKGPDACKIFLLSTRSGGLGVNLVAADTVIFYDTDWNPQVDRQAQDRAHRIGQTKPVLIFRLITRDTAEERIVKRAFAKQELSTLVMSGDQFSKQTSAAASAFAKGRVGKANSSRVEEWTALLDELKSESVQFEIADKKSQMISDEHLEMLLDRRPHVFEKRKMGWNANASGTATPSTSGSKTPQKRKQDSNGTSRATFEVTDMLESMEKDQDESGFIDRSATATDEE
ncbi:hypothetical protein L7F22_039326 [Adiantum nelumboides]|nr:hypothetical protein [Adiantum nelumboides]